MSTEHTTNINLLQTTDYLDFIRIYPVVLRHIEKITLYVQ